MPASCCIDRRHWRQAGAVHAKDADPFHHRQRSRHRRGHGGQVARVQHRQVERLTLTDDARVQVTLSIRGDNMKWVRKDSSARLLKEGLIGAAIIDITPGSAPAPVLAKNEPIAFSRESGLGEVVGKLRDEIVPILQDVKRITYKLPGPGWRLPPDSASHQYHSGEYARDAKRLDAVLRSTADELPGIMRSSRETIEGSKKIMDSVSRTWPISRNIEPTKAQTLRQDSYDAANDAVNGNSKQK